MVRKACLMTLKQGQQDEYERRHNPIWPELQETLRKHGVRNYSIFLNKNTDQLFLYAEIESEELWQRIAETETCRRWWTHMKALMFSNADDSPATVVLDEVFHLE